MQFPIAPVCTGVNTSCDFVAFTTATTFSHLSMVPGRMYVLVATAAAWICQGASPTATKGAGSFYAPAGLPIILDGRNGAQLSVLQDSSGGNAVLAAVLV
jgi:hypothetical protein